MERSVASCQMLKNAKSILGQEQHANTLLHSNISIVNVTPPWTFCSFLLQTLSGFPGNMKDGVISSAKFASSGYLVCTKAS
jgi:hypothetical protein